MSSEDNDAMVAALQEKIAVKRVALGTRPNWKPSTRNMTVTMGGSTVSINSATLDQLRLVACQMQSLITSQGVLGFKEVLFNGFVLREWLSEVLLRISFLEYDEKNMELDVLEEQLSELLSEPKRVEQALKHIASKLD